MWGVCMCVNLTTCTHKCCIRRVKRPGLLVELLKVKRGVIEQRVLHFHFPSLQMDRDRTRVLVTEFIISSLSVLKSFLLQGYDCFKTDFMNL